MDSRLSLIPFVFLAGCIAQPKIEPMSSYKVVSDDVLVEESKERIRSILLDPESALFREVEVIETVHAETGVTTRTVCGAVSGRNSFGGMTQPKLFYVNDLVGGDILSKDDADIMTLLGHYESYCSEQ